QERESSTADVRAAEDPLEAGLLRGRGPGPAAGHRVVVVGDHRLPRAPGGAPHLVLPEALAMVKAVDLIADVGGAGLTLAGVGWIRDESVEERAPVLVADPGRHKLLGSLAYALGSTACQPEHALCLVEPGLGTAGVADAVARLGAVEGGAQGVHADHPDGCER